MKKLLIVFGICVLGLVGLCAQPAQNAIWVIGDGMGPGTMGFFMEGVRVSNVPMYPEKQSVLEKFINESVTGMYFNNTAKTIVTDSGCAATQMATGVSSLPEAIGVDENQKEVQTLLEEAYAKGKSIGVVTDVYVEDATPAGFLTHTKSRKNHYEIARQLADSQAQVILGGGLKYFTQKENKDLLKQATQKGWVVVQDRSALEKVKSGRVLGLFAKKEMPFYGVRKEYPDTPTLVQMTQKAIELLSQNPKGFVLIVEAGKIDLTLHKNEGGPTLWEMVNLDETLSYVWNWARENGKTLVYLNADHETGVPIFEYRRFSQMSPADMAQAEMLYGSGKDYMAYTRYARLWEHKRLLYVVYNDFKKLPTRKQTAETLQQMVNEALGVDTDLHLGGQVPNSEQLIEKVNRAQGLVWATKTHSAGMLLGVANGPGASYFSGVYHNTDLKDKFEKALGWE